MGRLIAIGDIHGCSQAIETLIEAIAPTEQDTIVTLGDLIDRGPDSRNVVEQLMALQSRCRLIPLLGNHELMLISVLDGLAPSHQWQMAGGMQTIASYGGSVSQIPDSHLDFIRGFLPYHETDEFLFIHANYLADLDLEEQPEYTAFWEHLTNVMPPPHRSGKIAVVGHTPQTTGEILDTGHLICVDTCCFAGGWLTALDVQTRQTWQADVSGDLRVRVES